MLQKAGSGLVRRADLDIWLGSRFTRAHAQAAHLFGTKQQLASSINGPDCQTEHQHKFYVKLPHHVIVEKVTGRDRS